MIAIPASLTRQLRCACLSAFLVALAAAGVAQVPIIQPGAPGEPARELSSEEAIEIADTSYSPADATFMQDMIPHHHQAQEMAALVGNRTNRPELIDVAGRIDASQGDEIGFMQQWLRQRGESVPTHHEGAVKMVEELLEQPGSAYDPVLFEFTTDITNDQNAEIERMNALLVGLSDDPRAGLAAGFDDAGQALLNLKLVASLPKPDGYFDPRNPAGLPPERLQTDPAEDEEAAAAAEEGQDPEEEEDEEEERWPLLSFANTDMAFSGDVLVAGNYHGFNIYRLVDEGHPELISSVVCPGGQGDVSIVGDLLIMSVEETRGRLDCGLEGVGEDVSAERFRGLRILDISDLARPVQVGAVQTCRGSHTHSVVSGSGDDGKIIVYNSGTSSVREGEELEGCIDESPGDKRTALFRIDVIEIPVDRPAEARIVNSPAVFADPEVGVLGGLWRGGDHGDDTQETRQTDQCHDITVFPERGIAAGACSGNGILFDISDPLNPKRIDEVVDRGFAYWHSATFNNDGTYDPLDWGADAIYDIVDGKLEFRAHYKMPAPQLEQENCVAHNGSIVPVPGRDIFVQAWYQGGMSVVDFTDSANPFEIAYFDRGPIDSEDLILGGYWSTYWYNGRIYGTEIARGLDVLALVPSEHLSEHEIAAAAMADQGGVFNPQQQFRVSWPAEPVVAWAYLDQLERGEELPESLALDLAEALARSATQLKDGARDEDLAAGLESLASALDREGRGDTIAQQRRAALGETLGGIAVRLR